jgi:hypothetical protein
MALSPKISRANRWWERPTRVKKLSERVYRSWTGADHKETRWLMSDGTVETDDTVESLNTGDEDGSGRWGTDDGGW